MQTGFRRISSRARSGGWARAVRWNAVRRGHHGHGLPVLVLLACLAAVSCTTTRSFPGSSGSGKVRIRNESPQTYFLSQQLEDPAREEEESYEGLVLEDAQGNLRKFYYLRPGRFKAIEELLTAITGVPQERIESQPEWGLKGGKESPGFELMLVTGTEEDFEKVDSFLDSLEAHTPMIEIEAQIVEVMNSDDVQIGVQTLVDEIGKAGGDNDETLFRGIRGIFDTQDFIQAGLVGSEFQGSLFSLGTIQDEIALDIVIQALREQRLAKVLSTPKVTVLNGFRAEITIGDEVPIQTFKSVAGTALIDVEFKEAAVKLTVTPYIVGKDTIQMDIAPEVSRVTRFTDPGNRGLVNPIISTRNAHTTVNIRSGYTHVIGGLIGNTEIQEERKTPFLGDIPILRYLFRTTSTTTTDTNLLFIIKPKIIYPEFYGEVSDRIFDPEIPLEEDGG